MPETKTLAIFELAAEGVQVVVQLFKKDLFNCRPRRHQFEANKR